MRLVVPIIAARSSRSASASVGTSSAVNGGMIPGAACGCEARVAHAGWSPALLNSRDQTHLTSMNAAHRWFFAENYGEATQLLRVVRSDYNGWSNPDDLPVR